jgi:hypothetical protein
MSRLLLVIPIVFLIVCNRKPRPNEEMVRLLKEANKYEYNAENTFSSEAKIEFYDSVIKNSSSREGNLEAWQNKANALLELGKEEDAINILQELLKQVSETNFDKRLKITRGLAIAYLRLGERTNCIYNHGSESCIFPISMRGVHKDKTGSEKAIELYTKILFENPRDLEAKWLLNIAYMTTGNYPIKVPPHLLINIVNGDSTHGVKPFIDVAANVGLNIKNMSGGSIVDDFNNDGYLDIVLSGYGLNEPMHYCKNNGDGTFTDMSEYSGLGYLTGGLNMMQTDYNNDGFKDIFVLRGAWKGKFGKTPNSLLKNNGDNTFTDVTKEAGLLSFHPTQTATWADFNNDGWLDVFIGNESDPVTGIHLSELYVSNRNGTFTEQAIKASCAIDLFVKGVTSGDYDHDGKLDIFISTLNGNKILLKNESVIKGQVKFRDVTQQAGLNTLMFSTFPTWFWDYDNDGWLDILVSGYEYLESPTPHVAAETMGMSTGRLGKILLFKNKGDGSFEDVSEKAGVNKISFAMGSNFGDIDNDGYLDFYLGTGHPTLTSLVPNRLFKNLNGTKFLDVTTLARVGNLQKGHEVSFADMDNDGDEDIYVEMGGAYSGDAYENSFYLNPGQNDNHWINISLEGMVSNKAAIGTKVKVVFKENKKQRSIYREVNSGGSFGANPLRPHIGIGKATIIDSLEITWPATNKTQVFKNIPVDINIRIKEGDNKYASYELRKYDFETIRTGLIPCPPKQ